MKTLILRKEPAQCQSKTSRLSRKVFATEVTESTERHTGQSRLSGFEATAGKNLLLISLCVLCALCGNNILHGFDVCGVFLLEDAGGDSFGGVALEDRDLALEDDRAGV